MPTVLFPVIPSKQGAHHSNYMNQMIHRFQLSAIVVIIIGDPSAQIFRWTSHFSGNIDKFKNIFVSQPLYRPFSLFCERLLRILLPWLQNDIDVSNI
jgi:hypothetical protein